MPLPAHEYLDQHSIPYQAKTFPTSTEKGAANVANALGFRERQMIKTLIYTLADTGEHILVMVGGDQNVKSGLLKKAAGSRNIGMASPNAIIALTGYAIGSIPPFCWHPEGFGSFLDESTHG
jgi:Cys-tRNA(Pro)/Cys-tRNA(Cys) deacylase